MIWFLFYLPWDKHGFFLSKNNNNTKSFLQTQHNFHRVKEQKKVERISKISDDVVSCGEMNKKIAGICF